MYVPLLPQQTCIQKVRPTLVFLGTLVSRAPMDTRAQDFAANRITAKVFHEPPSKPADTLMKICILLILAL